MGSGCGGDVGGEEVVLALGHRRRQVGPLLKLG